MEVQQEYYSTLLNIFHIFVFFSISETGDGWRKGCLCILISQDNLDLTPLLSHCAPTNKKSKNILEGHTDVCDGSWCLKCSLPDRIYNDCGLENVIGPCCPDIFVCPGSGPEWVPQSLVATKHTSFETNGLP